MIKLLSLLFKDLCSVKFGEKKLEGSKKNKHASSIYIKGRLLLYKLLHIIITPDSSKICKLQRFLKDNKMSVPHVKCKRHVVIL